MIGLVEADLQDVIQPLITALADSNPFVRGTAAIVLADYGEEATEVLPHLERLLADDEFIRVTAVHGALCIAPGRTEELTVLNTLNNLGSAAAPATPALVTILTDGDDIIARGIAAEVL